MKKLLNLFFTFFKIGLFTFGGGYAMIALIQSETVQKKNWISGDELLNIVAVAESTPGPIAINCATYIGYKRAGVLGSLFATLGVVLPSFIIIFAISFFIESLLQIELINNAFKGIQAAIAVLIIRAGVKMLKNIKKNAFSIIVLMLALAITVTFNFIGSEVSSIYLIMTGGVLGYIYYGLIRKESTVNAPETNQIEDDKVNADLAINDNVQSDEEDKI
ncbi:MAG: chromate transporter [Clostridia bacterium]|nr:chromate transporter [Clostridia bacterium]